VRRTSLVCGGVLVGIGVLALLEVLRMRDGWTGARLMPAVVGAGLVGLGLAHARIAPAAVVWPDADGARRVVLVVALLALYVASLPWLGFLFATALFVLPLVRWLGGWSWPAVLVTTAAVAIASDVVFRQWLGMPLPTGVAGF
jgi:hypothetical protein